MIHSTGTLEPADEARWLHEPILLDPAWVLERMRSLEWQRQRDGEEGAFKDDLLAVNTLVIDRWVDENRRLRAELAMLGYNPDLIEDIAAGNYR